MKTVITVFVALNLLFVALAGGLFLLSEIYPFQPDHLLYGVQLEAEQWRLNLTSGETRQADMALDLAERRLADLANANGDEQIARATGVFDEALNEAIRRVGAAAFAQQTRLRDRLDALLVRAEVVVAALKPAKGTAAIADLSRKIAALQAAGTQQELSAVLPEMIAAVPIPFLGQVIDHEIFPLTGGHAEARCEQCHTDGKYAGTPAECSECHSWPPPKPYPDYIPVTYELALPIRFAPDGLFPEDFDASNPYPDHFAGECSDCHVIDSWYPSQFDHQGVLECRSCHGKEDPPGHYPTECVVCHQEPADWREAAFEHGDYTDCEACHLDEAPVYKYATACAGCHHPQGWTDSPFSYTSFPARQTCLRLEQTDEHYTGACVNCHNTESWTDVSFDHTEYTNCVACHTADTPELHFPGAVFRLPRHRRLAGDCV